ncbi:MAG TPA: hypothetical protein VGR90_07505, partial [Acidimicrobiales bacterium]|nr:hypothetical protein [Acidimicrobiales bacterium]
SVDRQSVTVRFDRGRVQLTRGVAPDAGLVITLDFDNMSGPGAPKPQVKGAMRHPLLGLSVARVLEPPTGTWQEEAARFWSFASSEPRMPGSMLVVCTDEGGQLRLGAADGPPAYELHGPASALVSVFSGQTIAGQEFLAGKLKAVGSFEHASVLTGRSIGWVLGEGR